MGGTAGGGEGKHSHSPTYTHKGVDKKESYGVDFREKMGYSKRKGVEVEKYDTEKVNQCKGE